MHMQNFGAIKKCNMVVVGSETDYIYIPKLLKCKLSECNDYLMILHSNYNKDVWVYKLRDYNYSPLRFQFYIEFPEEFEQGEYTYFVVKYDERITDDLSAQYPEKTDIIPDKGSVSFKGLYIISGDTMLVTNRFKGIIKNEGDYVIFKDYGLISSYTTDDKSVSGNLVTKIDVLNSGLLKYHVPEKICCDKFYDGKENKSYMQYGG